VGKGEGMWSKGEGEGEGGAHNNFTKPRSIQQLQWNSEFRTTLGNGNWFEKLMEDCSLAIEPGLLGVDRKFNALIIRLLRLLSFMVYF